MATRLGNEAFPAVLFAGQSQYELVISLLRDTVTVVGPVADNPYDVTVKSCYKLPVTIGMAYFDVGKVVAYQFVAFHAERYEPIAVLPWADGYSAALKQ